MFKVQLIATNKPGCKSSFDSSIKIVWSSIQNQIELEPINIQIYPNPFIDNAIINYSISKKSFVDIGLYDLSGEKITNLYSNLKDKGIYTLNINAEKLSMKPGTYFIGILIDDKLSMKKLIRMDSH